MNEQVKIIHLLSWDQVGNKT